VDWGDCRHVGDSLDQYPSNRNAFWALLDSYDVVAYLVGHTHRYSRYLKDDVWQVDAAQARGTGQYDTYIRVFVGDDDVTFHTYRSLYNGIFAQTDSWTVHRPSTPIDPIIAEVTPDPDSIKDGRTYIKQLALIQGYPYPAWSVVSGPTGLSVDSLGLVSGWIPTYAQAGNTYGITIRATNSEGSDDESWDVSVINAADFDMDDDVDIEDFGYLQRCYSGMHIPPVTGCSDADLDGDNDVDQVDFNEFKAHLCGVGNPSGC
jgi:hypothetical protein